MNEKIFIDDYIKLLNEKLTSENKKCYISGDFNFDLLSASDHNGTFNFFDTMITIFLLPTITLPTKINSVKSTVIDNIFTNWNETLETTNNDVNHSLGIFVTKINILLDKYMPLKKVTKKEYL